MRFLAAFLILPLLYAASLADWKLLRTVDLRSETHHVQGIEIAGTRLWVTSVDSPHRKGFLHEFDLATGQPNRELEIGQGERFHPGGIAAGDDSLWVPVAEYRRNSSSVIQRRSQRTLETTFQFEVADHIGCIAVVRDHLLGGNWDARQFYEWDLQGRLLRKVDNPTGNAYQDMKFAGSFIVASGLLPGRTGAIDWLEYPSLRLVRRITAGVTSRGAPYTREGMTIHKNQLFLLPEDSPSRLFIFQFAAR